MRPLYANEAAGTPIGCAADSDWQEGRESEREPGDFCPRASRTVCACTVRSSLLAARAKTCRLQPRDALKGARPVLNPVDNTSTYLNVHVAHMYDIRYFT